MPTALSVPVYLSLSESPDLRGQARCLLSSPGASMLCTPPAPFGPPAAFHTPHPPTPRSPPWAGPSPLAALLVEQRRVVEGQPRGGAPPERPLRTQVSGTDAGPAEGRAGRSPLDPEAHALPQRQLFSSPSAHRLSSAGSFLPLLHLLQLLWFSPRPRAQGAPSASDLMTLCAQVCAGEHLSDGLDQHV